MPVRTVRLTRSLQRLHLIFTDHTARAIGSPEFPELEGRLVCLEGVDGDGVRLPKSITHLGVSATASVGPLVAQLPQLEHLVIEQTSVADMRTITSATITTLDIRMPPREPMLEMIQLIPKSVVHLYVDLVVEEDVAAIVSRLPNLQTLCARFGWGHASVHTLLPLRSLTDLTIAYSTPTGLDALAGLRLKRLMILGCGARLRDIPAIPSLRHLFVDDINMLKSDMFAKFPDLVTSIFTKNFHTKNF